MNQWYPWSFSSENEKGDGSAQKENKEGEVFSPVADELLGVDGVVEVAPSSARLVLLKHVLEETGANIAKALDILNAEMNGGKVSISDLHEVDRVLNPTQERAVTPSYEDSSQRVIEGVFDGQHMVGSDGKQYSVPANYASKSKLVEGDIMKLTIGGQGTFIYKQIGPVERRRVIAVLDQHPDTHDYQAVCGTQRWRVLTASVTYFKGMHGDEVVVMVPQETPAKWAAVENVIKKL